MNTANAVLQLHQRLRSADEPTSTGNNNLMLKELENAVIMTQNVLTKITTRYELGLNADFIALFDFLENLQNFIS